MPATNSRPVFAFVWRLDDITKAVVDMAHGTLSSAIGDLGETGLPDGLGRLKAAGADEVKVSADLVFDPVFQNELAAAGVQTLWVEYHPALSTLSLEDFFRLLTSLSSKFECIPVLSDPGFLARLVREDPIPNAIGIKGADAAGFVSTETTGILYSLMQKEIGPLDHKPHIIIWGGIATPEAAAAFLCTGAGGIVFESLHWLTDQVQMGDTLRGRLAKLRPEHTTLVGRDMGVPFRLFDKGNAVAARELQQYAASLGIGNIGDQDRRSFARKIADQSVPPLESALDHHELIPLGPEASFAEGFARRFGRNTHQAVDGFVQETARLCRDAPKIRDRFLRGPATKGLGIRYPFIQGAMTWITDVPEFAKAVAQAGGLPTVALGVRDRNQLEQDFSHLRTAIQGSPFAVNLLALSENPYRDQQLAWIEETRPPFVVIAAGTPADAAMLLSKGVEALLVAPDADLLRMALEAGVRYIILEGSEAGGHIGIHSTLTLAQIALEMKRRDPALFEDVRIILAGGIFSPESALRAALMGADAVQMGTAYLATREIVRTAALTPLYQRMILDSPPGGTVVSGESVALRVRSLNTSKMESILELEREFWLGEADETVFRRRLEVVSANSLLMAARAVDRPGGASLSEDACRQEGQFMSGADAGIIDRVQTIKALHQGIAEGVVHMNIPEPSWDRPPQIQRSPAARRTPERIAITGMAMVNSLGNRPPEIWAAALAMKSGIVEVPISRWDVNPFYNPDPRARGKTYCRVGGFQHIQISRKELGIPPQDFRTMADSTKLTMLLAEQAVTDADILSSHIPRERISVLISQNSGESASTIGQLIVNINAPDIIRSLKGVLNLTPQQASAAAQELKATCLGVDDTTLLGRLNCAAGGFLSNKYGFMGPSYSVSAACATSLVALFSAVQMIRNGVIDAALVGGGEENLHPAHYLEFSALGALAGISGNSRAPKAYSRPFDAERDGMVLGEGGAMIVIERESIAKQRGARIYAYITGMGASNNHLGMVESSAETQEIAIRGSFADCGYGPESIDLVECHATSTTQGDIEEVKALKAIFTRGSAPVLTSFKSQIGHTLGASGLMALIRGILAMGSGIYPATLNYHTPDPQIDLEAWGFRVPIEPWDWPRNPERVRRLMVNAFGFGGANYVLQLEGVRNGADALTLPLEGAASGGIEAQPEAEAVDVEGVSLFTSHLADQSWRLGVVAEDPADAAAKIRALDLTHMTPPASDRIVRTLAREGIYAAPADLPIAPTAFVFAGQGTHYSGMAKELYETFPLIRQWMDRIAQAADFDILDLLFNSREEDLQKTRWQQPALFTMEYAVAQYLVCLGVRPSAMAGHSLGELTALSIAGVFSWEDGFRIVNKRAQCMDKASGSRKDPGTMIAVDAPAEFLEKKLSSRKNIFFTNFNSPHQVVLGGDTVSVLDLMDELHKEGYRATQLRVSMAFHSPIMEIIHNELEEFISPIPFHPPTIPVISNTTMTPFPRDPQEIKRIVMAHLEAPVHWMQNVEALWNDFDIRLFVEVGPKDTLCGLISDTLRGARCIPTCGPEAEAQTFRAAAAQLYAQGQLKPVRTPVHISFPYPITPKAQGSAPRSYGDDPAARVVQREINTFIVQNFGAALKRRILEALRREIDHSFDEAQLDALLGAGEYQVHTSGQALKPPFRPEGSLPPSPTSAPARREGQPHPRGEAEYLEAVIRIIMDATGYERDEIEPDMDIRQDLAIRSSRLPVIMDAAEHRFGITIYVEDFIGLRTVRELAQRISEVAAGGPKRSETALPMAGGPLAPPAGIVEDPADKKRSTEKGPIKRLVFQESPLPDTPLQPLVLPPGREVALLTLGTPSTLCHELADFFSRHFQARPFSMDILATDKEGKGCDIRTSEGADKAGQCLARSPSLAGLVIVLEGDDPSLLTDMPAATNLLTGFYACLTGLTRSAEKAFCFVVQRGLDPGGTAAVAAEGVLGMFLAAQQEYQSMRFRSVAVDDRTPVKQAMEQALNADLGLVQLQYRGGNGFTLQARVQPLPQKNGSALALEPGDVIVVSGGGRGITSRLAEALAPFGPEVVLLGRTKLDDSVDYKALLSGPDDTGSRIRKLVMDRDHRQDTREIEAEVSKLRAGMEIACTMSVLSGHGMAVSYRTCDVTDEDQVQQVLADVAERHGKIDGVIHGAGILRDSFMQFMTPADFQSVVAVKLVGAWNLYRFAKKRGLRFMMGLSSITAVQGNAGQVNYCAANRSLSAFLRALARAEPELWVKALLLPPIEGTGMADDPEVKELLRLRNMEDAYLHVSEMGEMICRELLLGSPHDPWVMLARNLPTVKTAAVDFTETESDGMLSVAGVSFPRGNLPMIHGINRLDLRSGLLEAKRTFSRPSDLWIEDHRPFKFLKHPLVSAIMAIEAFLETAYLLFPHLTVIALHDVVYRDILECPPGVDREARVLCQRVDTRGGQVVCRASLLTADLSPTGRHLDRETVNYEAIVALGSTQEPLPHWPGFTVQPEDLDSRPMPQEEVLDWYEKRTALKNRYRVIKSLEGSGPGVVRGEMVYPETQDFAGSDTIRYHYSPYILEGLMHLATFYLGMRDKEDRRDMIPSGIEELRFDRPCRGGERIMLEARQRSEDNEGLTWDARAVDASGATVMHVRGMRMNWFKS
jgi:acyl transferase domain-containing protein/NAD(P)H-dependent flavin oxidoreductase YrpB (nitropropane dioxygenase family)/NAD(P)-dependent dehydrogenase (short-subunit alcohol dehydrogenase family)/acyl carrier protein